MKERSLVLIKPDAIIDKRDSEIKEFLSSKGMRIVQERDIWFTAESLRRFYQNPIPEDSFNKMLDLYRKKSAALVIFEGEDAIAIGQETKNFFRQKYNYGYYGSTIHAADNTKEYLREINYLLSITYHNP